jgi:hypothetical protein
MMKDGNLSGYPRAGSSFSGRYIFTKVHMRHKRGGRGGKKEREKERVSRNLFHCRLVAGA